MKTLAIVLLAALIQQPGLDPRQVTHQKHPRVQPETILAVQPAESQSAFQQLLKIGVANHMPIGMVIGVEPSICRAPLALNSDQQTVKELIANINTNLPGYHASLQDGVLEVLPTALPDEVSTLLNMRLQSVGIPANSIDMMGSELWMHIRLMLAPDQGATFGGMSSSLLEIAPGFQVTNQTVNSILNRVVDAANGGVWILQTSMVKKDLPSTTQQPYEIYGYVGEEQRVTNLKCPQ